MFDPVSAPKVLLVGHTSLELKQKKIDLNPFRQLQVYRSKSSIKQTVYFEKLNRIFHLIRLYSLIFNFYSLEMTHLEKCS